MGLEPADLAGAVPGHGGEQLAVRVGDPQRGVAGFDGDDAPGMGQADLDALAGDPDGAAAGDLPLDDRAGGRQRLRAGQPDALQLVPLAGRDRARQGAPQHAVLGEDVHDLPVEADAGALPGQRGADGDGLVGEGDDAGGADQPLDFVPALLPGTIRGCSSRCQAGAVNK